MGNQAPESNYETHTSPQATMALSVLSEEAFETLMDENKTNTLTSSAQMTEYGLMLETTSNVDDDKQVMLINSEEETGMDLGAAYLNSDLTMTITEDGETRIEKGKFALRHSHWSEWMDDKTSYNVAFSRSTNGGNPIQSFIPAESYRKGRELDPNGQPVRLAREIDGANCKFDWANRGGGNYNCEYIVNDASHGKFSFNETRKQEPAGHFNRIVARDSEGNVLGIITQDFDLDARGNLTNVITRARRPKGYKAK